MTKPLEQRDGYACQDDHPLVAALRSLRQAHSLVGCVLISFDGERVGVTSSGADIFGGAMQELADKILTAIDDGKFDPELATEH